VRAIRIGSTLSFSGAIINKFTKIQPGRIYPLGDMSSAQDCCHELPAGH